MPNPEEIYKTKVLFVHHKILGYDDANPRFIEKCNVYRITPFKDERILINLEGNGVIYPIIIDGYWQGSFVILSNTQIDFPKVEAFTQFLTVKYQL